MQVQDFGRLYHSDDDEEEYHDQDDDDDDDDPDHHVDDDGYRVCRCVAMMMTTAASFRKLETLIYTLNNRMRL